MVTVFNVPFPLAQTASSGNDTSAENGIIDKVCGFYYLKLHIPAVGPNGKNNLKCVH